MTAPVRVARWRTAGAIALAAMFVSSAAAQGPAPGDAIQALRAAVGDAIRRPGVARGLWGIAVQSLTTGQRLVEVNPDALLVPGSISKLLSVATAVDAVGWDYQFETTLRATGPIVDGTLRGDLIVVGSGDPSMGGRAGDNLSVWIDALKAHGVRRIEGRVIGDDDDIEDARPQLAWAWDDLGYTSGALFGALNLGENVMVVTVVPSSGEGDATTLSVEPTFTDRPLVNRSTTGARGSRLLLWPEQRPGETALTIAGAIPAGAAPARLTIAVGNPTAWLAGVLRRRLALDGIEVTGGAFDIDDAAPKPSRETSTVLYRYRSHPLSELTRPLLKDSVNLYGESLLRLNAPADALRTNDAALAGMRARLDAWGIAPDAHQIVDGSGLSRRSVISADAVLGLLRHLYDPTGASPLMSALPIAGVDGSLQNRMKGTPAAGSVRAKTGTMSNVRTLAGYVTTRDRETLAFVVMVNNFEGPGSAALDAIDAIAVQLASFSRTLPN